MEIILRIICTRDGSLREKIAADKRLKDFSLTVTKHKMTGRNPGWAKIHSHQHPGAININWDKTTNILVCRAVTRGFNKADGILGTFIAYVFARHRKRIKAIIF